MRTLVLLAAGWSLLVAVPAAAQSADGAAVPARMAAARELMELVRIKEAALAGVVLAMEQQVRANPAMAPYRGVMEDWARDIFSSDEAKDAFATMYAQEFTESELKGLVAFYRTPLGQRVAEKQAVLTQRGSEVGRRLAEAHQADLMARLQQAPADTTR